MFFCPQRMKRITFRFQSTWCQSCTTQPPESWFIFWSSLIHMILISFRVLFFLVPQINSYAEIYLTFSHISRRGLFNMNLSFLACSMHFMFTDWAIVYVPVLALYYVIASFICITNQSTHFFTLWFFFFFLFFFLLFKQIKRFLLNIQAIVSPPSHDFALSPLHAACLLRCVCRVSLCSRRLGLLTPCVSTWGWMRAAFCVACLSVLLCQLASRSA